NIPLIKAGQIVSEACYSMPVLPVTVKIRVKLFLEGFLKPDGSMQTTYQEEGMLPLEQPYGNSGFSYFGSESVMEFEDDIVDWILLELWNQNNIVIKQQAVLLRKDGWLVDLEGNNEILLQDFYPEPTNLVIYHRSHLGVYIKRQITPNTIDTQTIDITTSDANVLGKSQLKMVHGRFALIAGDVDQNGLIDTRDFDQLSEASKTAGMQYENADLNADGMVDDSDLMLWQQNRSKIGYPGVHKILKNS
ncbi:MAG: hypothetical protein AAFO07_31385, partial [Bacteroidota bacterium]